MGRATPLHTKFGSRNPAAS